MSSRTSIRRPDYWLWFVSLAAAYAVAGKLGISLSVAHDVITPVWAPSGIALAALLIGGRSLWPAVMLGAFLTNVTSGASPLVAAAIACGNTLEPIAASSLLERARFRIDLGRVRDVLVLVLFGAGVATLVSATNGVAALSLAGADRGSLGSDWLLWWFGDAVGVMMVTPVLLLAYTHRRARPTTGRLLEALVLASSLCATTAFVFLGGAWRYPYLIFPLLLWAALRFHQLGAAASSFLVGALATWGTVVGAVPLDVSSATGRVQLIQALVGMVAVSLLTLGATLAERVGAQRSAEETAARLKEAQALTHIGSWEWDLAADHITWSDELYRIFGIPSTAAMSSRSFLERVHPEDRPRVRETAERASQDGRPFSLEYRIVTEDRQPRILHSRARVIGDGHAESLRLVGTAQDVTEQRQTEMLRADVLSVVSHELRTPLAAILNYSVALKKRRHELDEQRAERILDQVVRQTRRVDRLLVDLLELDRLRHGLVSPQREPTDVARLIAEIADGHRLGDRAIAVQAEPMLANVDAPKLERIVDNLLLNAVKHTPPGTPVTLRLEREESDLLIVVDDEGPGIPREHRTAVFDLFDRGSKAPSSQSGTGIGLALVGRLAALHRGYAWVEESPSGGASVRVLLPDCVVSETAELAGRWQ